MLRPDTLARLEQLRGHAHILLRALVALDLDAGNQDRVRLALLLLAEHLQAWQAWAARLEQEIGP